MVPLVFSMLILNYLCGLAEAQIRYSVDEFSAGDFAEYSDTVQFYYLVASFPYNAPSNIV